MFITWRSTYVAKLNTKILMYTRNKYLWKVEIFVDNLFYAVCTGSQTLTFGNIYKYL